MEDKYIEKMLPKRMSAAFLTIWGFRNRRQTPGLRADAPAHEYRNPSARRIRPDEESSWKSDR